MTPMTPRLFQRQVLVMPLPKLAVKAATRQPLFPVSSLLFAEVAGGRIRVEVEERLGKTEGEPGELDEVPAVGEEALRVGKSAGVTNRE